MLLYSRDSGRTFASYDSAYSASPQHFVLANSAKELVRRLVAVLPAQVPLAILEVGCGQGEFLEFARQEIVARAAPIAPVLRCVGVDGSSVAIAQCAEHFPESDWVCDELRQFVNGHEACLSGQRYDLVLDKSGTTFLETEESAARFLESVSQLLVDDGRYVYIASKSFYDDKLKPRAYARWSTDWIGVARRVFPYVEDVSDSGYYRFIFARKAVSSLLHAGDVSPPVLDRPAGLPATPPQVLAPQAPAPGPPRVPPSEPQRSEDFPRFLKLLSSFAIDVVELSKWNDGVTYFGDLLDALPAQKVTVEQSLDLPGPFVALRHDCDNSLQNALAMARAEYLRGVRSTYYLLHPDGFVARSNYYGALAGGRLELHPELVNAALYLQDLGHEVALHNDFITLGIYLKRNPHELLAEQVELLREGGVRISGTASHGSKVCAEGGYVNYQMFSEFAAGSTAEQYRNSRVEFAGFVVEKFEKSFTACGLRYEAYRAPRDAVLSDSGARFTAVLGNGNELRPTSVDEVREAVARLATKLAAGARLQVLIHPCHWLAHVCGNPRVASAVIRRYRGDA